jgi:hypothetical protein
MSLNREGLLVHYVFKPHDLCLNTANDILCTSLDKVGLSNLEPPEISLNLIDCHVSFPLKVIAPLNGNLEKELASYVESGDLRYLIVTITSRLDTTGLSRITYYQEYWPAIISGSHVSSDD